MSKPPRRDDARQRAAEAAREGRAEIMGLGAVRGADAYFHRGHTPGLLGQWEQRLAARLVAGETTCCAHLDADHAQVHVWFVYLPETVHCVPCAVAAAEAVQGTPADDICDGCGKTSKILCVVASEIPGAVVGYPPLREGPVLPETAFGPTIVRGGLCPACDAPNRAAAQAASLGQGVRIHKGGR